MKTISVLVAAYQAEQWLAECIQSIQQQTLPDGWQLEILVGIDGCKATEKTANVCLSNHFQNHNYRDDKLEVISMSKNFGTYITFNTLMAYATGQLICRFDADDVMRAGYLNQQIQQLQQGVDMTMTWSIYTDVHLKPTSQVKAHPNYRPPGGLNRRGSEGQFVIHRKVWERLGGFRAWRCAADSDFLERVRYAGFNIHIIEAFLYFRRTHPNSLIAHPATQFGSTLRTKLETVRADLIQQYQHSMTDLKIEPIIGTIND